MQLFLALLLVSLFYITLAVWIMLQPPLKLGHRSFAVFLNLMGGRMVLYSHANAFIPHELDLGGVTASIVDAEDKDSDDL